MNSKTVDTMYKALQQENQGIVIILEDTRKEIDRFLEKYEKIAGKLHFPHGCRSTQQ